MKRSVDSCQCHRDAPTEEALFPEDTLAENPEEDVELSPCCFFWDFSQAFDVQKKKKRKKSFVAPFSLGFEWKFSLDQTELGLVWTLREMLET